MGATRRLQLDWIDLIKSDKSSDIYLLISSSIVLMYSTVYTYTKTPIIVAA